MTASNQAKVIQFNRQQTSQIKQSQFSDSDFEQEEDPNKAIKQINAAAEALLILIENKIDHTQVNVHHIRIHADFGKTINYYPLRGTVNIDNNPRLKGRGLEFLKELLRREGLLK